MYDAISSAMQRYTYPDVPKKPLIVKDGEDLSDDSILFKVLKRSNILNKSVDMAEFEYLSKTLDEALDFQLENFDRIKFLELCRDLLNQMGVISESDQLMKWV